MDPSELFKGMNLKNFEEMAGNDLNLKIAGGSKPAVEKFDVSKLPRLSAQG
jgi:hypothetical protein